MGEERCQLLSCARDSVGEWSDNAVEAVGDLFAKGVTKMLYTGVRMASIKSPALGSPSSVSTSVVWVGIPRPRFSTLAEMSPSGDCCDGAVPTWNDGSSPTVNSDGRVNPNPVVPKLYEPGE